MGTFRFAIMGPGNMGRQFCRAVTQIPDCEVVAVASKSMERAQQFAERFAVPHCYDSYEEMLIREKPDCVYIAVLPNDHYRLTMLCLDHRVPVLCEKAMFCSGAEAEEVFRRSRELGVFVMEALWSRYLPAVQQVKQWISEGRIGSPELVQFSIGFVAPPGEGNRYFSRALGGGAAKDITVYAYHLTKYILGQSVREMTTAASWSKGGVDVNNHIAVEFDHTLADLMASFLCPMEERMVIYGTEGKIVLPQPHFSRECFLYGNDGVELAQFAEQQRKIGLTYEIIDSMQCIRNGAYQSDVVPQADTLECARMFDMIEATRP